MIDMSRENISVININFKNWQRAITEITGFDNPRYWQKLEHNPDFDKKGLYRATLFSENTRITAAVISSHFLHTQGIVNNMIISAKLSPATASKIASILIQVAVSRLIKLNSKIILARIPDNDENRTYFENNGFHHHKTLIYMVKSIKDAAELSSNENDNKDIEILRLADDSQIPEFVDLNQQIFDKSESEPLYEEEIKEWLVSDPSFSIDQMFFAVEKKTGQKVGVGHYFYYPAENRGGIFGIGVAKEHRGKGIATLLIKAIIKDMSTKGGNIASIECYTGTRAEKLYLKMGFLADNVDIILKWSPNYSNAMPGQATS
ncbi:MAG: GNAT family N-acetyltransferase [Candidatus Hodarchaeales archaeon]